jgi:hypothetical protein
MKKLLLLALTLAISTIAGDFSYGGYLKNSTALLFQENVDTTPLYHDPVMFTDAAELRLEGGFEWSKGGIEAHLIVAKTFRPLIPYFEAYKTNSLMMNIGEDYLRAYLSLITPEMESSLPPGLIEEFGGLFTEEQLIELGRLGMQLPYSSFFPTDMFMLDRALIKLYLPFADIYVGRQPITWGTGYAFNPTDLFNLKNPADAEAPKLGVNAIRAEIPLGDLAGISLVASPGRDFTHSSGGGRLKWNLSGFDMSVSGQSIMNADRAIMYLKRKIVVGTDLAGQIGNVGVWYEAAAINRIYGDYDNFDSLYFQVDVGADYTFDNGIYLMAEYLFSSLGKDSWEKYDIWDMANMSGGDAPGMGRHYLFGGLRKEVGAATTLSLFALGNLQDHSAMILPEIGYLFHDNIDVKFKAGFGSGDKEKSEFGSLKSSVGIQFTGYF